MLDTLFISEKQKNKSVVKIQNVFKCPAWGVRGHQRHLKSGAIIFVKPYVKGKYRNDPTKYVDKKYQL